VRDTGGMRGTRRGAHAARGGSGVTVRGARCRGAQREAQGVSAHGASFF
jgi:hypothetical protein